MSTTQVVIGGKPLGKFKASWLLFKESLRFLKADKEMLWIPIVTSLMSMMLFALLCTITFVVVWGGSLTALESSAEGSSEGSPLVYVFLFVAYVISAFTLAISQAGIAHIVYIRIHGGDATLGQGLSTAFSHWFSLLLWSLITSTVGVVLQMVAERSKIIMQIVTSLLGAAWTVLTYFVVPAMVIDKKSAFASISHSASVFKKTWGETLVSNISLGVVFMFLNLLIIFVGIGLAITAVVFDLIVVAIVIVVFMVVCLFLSALTQSTLNGVIKTLLYVYASEGKTPSNFNAELLEKMLARSIVPTILPSQSIPHTSFINN